MDVTATALAALVVGVTAFALLKKGKNHNAAPVDVNGEKVYRSAQHPTSLVEDENGVTTLYESFLQSVKKYGNQNCTGTRKKTGKDTYGKYEWKTYSQVQKLAEQFASAIMAIGAKSGDRIGIFSKNREEWLIAQQGCFSQSLVIVSFYETLGKDSIRYVAHHADIEIALCNQESLSKLFEVMEGKEGYKGLKHIIVLDEYEDDKSSFVKRAKDVGVSLHLFSDFINQGNSKPVKPNPPKPSDLCTIMYTSGTTGTPKGVLLTHKNLAAELGAIFKAIDIPKTPRYLSYLPLAHIFERVIILACLHAGGHIGFFHGDIQAIPDDVKELKPAVFVGVPKIYERTKDAVEKKVSGSPLPARLAFSVAFNIKKFAILYAPWMPVGFLDALVFNKVKAALGGAVELMISAGAPLSNQSELFLRICFGVPVSQAYGLTETCGASCVKMPTDSTVGHLGGPIPCNEYKLVDLKDMGYTTNDKPNPRGELLIRGHNVTQGYFKDEEKTNEALNKDGWFLTGDIAEYNTKTGSFTIIDRKKNLFKLSQGEYVAVEQVEDKLTKQIDSIEQICVYGDSQQSTLVAIVVKKGGSKGGQDGGSKEDREDMKKQLADAGKKAGLQGFEIPRNVWFAKEPFTAENDLMTPTMKLKRNTIKDTYKKAIEQMYKEGTGR